MARKEFLVLYDYGQGGLWAIIRADTAQQIRDRYPQLQVFEKRPSFLSADMLADLQRKPAADIDDPPTGWLADLDIGPG